MKRTHHAILLAAMLILVSSFTECYKPAGRGDGLPKHIKSLAIPPFQNPSLRFKVEQRFTAAMVDEAIRRGRSLNVVSTAEGADAVMLHHRLAAELDPLALLGFIGCARRLGPLFRKALSHPQTSQRAAFFRQVLERIRALPGVAAVGAVSRIPMAQGNNSGTMTGENSAVGPNDPQVETEMRWASPAYFQTMGIALLNGRDFSDADAEGMQPVAIMDESFVRRFYPNEDPIGKRIKRGGPQSTRPWKTIVGVVRSVRNQRLDATSLPQAYFPVFQEAGEMYNLSFAVHSGGGEPLALAQSVRAAVLAVDRSQPVFDVKPLRQIVADSIALRRLALLLLGVFAVVAVLLAGSGIYGVMAYAVAQRTHEIGIRMALGAQTRDVLRLVLRQGLKLTCAGVALGWLAALGLTRLLEKLLYGVSATDPLTFGGVAALLVAIALLACYLPARQAARVDPLIALRQE